MFTVPQLCESVTVLGDVLLLLSLLLLLLLLQVVLGYNP